MIDSKKEETTNDEEDIEVDDDIDDLMNDFDRLVETLGPCAKIYLQLDDCLEKHRPKTSGWKECQPFVMELAKCNKKHPMSNQRISEQQRRLTMMQMKEVKQKIQKVEKDNDNSS